MKTLKIMIPIPLVCFGIYILEYFGHKKMGMMRYLVFMKREFENGLFQPILFGVMMVLVLVLLGWLLMKHQKSTLALQVSILCLLIWSLTPFFQTLLSYHFGICGFLGAVFWALGWTFYDKLKQKAIMKP